MGYIIHASCDRLADKHNPRVNRRDISDAKARNVDYQTRKRRVERKRRALVQDSLDDAAIWSLIISLPLEEFSIQDEFPHDRQRLVQGWLGDGVDIATAQNVFWNISHRISYQGFHQPQYTSEDPQLSRKMSLIISNDDYIPEHILHEYRYSYPRMFSINTNIRTWADAKLVAAVLGLWSEHGRRTLELQVIIDQANRTRKRLGLDIGIKSDLNVSIAKELKKKRHDDLTKAVKGYALSEKRSLIIAKYIKRKEGVISTMLPRGIMSPNQLWFDELIDDLILCDPSNGSVLSNWVARAGTILRELTHARTSLRTYDTKVSQYSRMPEGVEVISFKTPLNERGWYKPRMCLKLANGWGQRHQSHWAEDNADNWEYFALIYVVEAIYPEFDFPYQLDPDGKFSFHPGRRRKSLRHHCSLLNCLRHVDLGSILDLDGYDREQDSWVRRGNRPPTNKVELQKVLRKLMDDQSSQKRDVDKKLRDKLGNSYEQDP